MPPWAALAPLVLVSSSILIQNRCQMVLGCLGLSCIGFLFNSYSNLIPNAPWAALAPLVLGSYSILIQNWCQMLPGVLAPLVLVSYSILVQNWCQMVPGLPWLIMYRFPIQFSFKFDTKCLWAALDYHVLVSYSIPIQN